LNDSFTTFELKLRGERNPLLKPRTGLKIENLVQRALDNQSIHPGLSMLLLHFGQNELGRIAVVETTELSLLNQ
jgi:hypothetical protein